MKIFLLFVTTLFPCVFSELPLYNPRGFRPSQPFPLPDKVQRPVPAKQYGPPKPEYGVPNKPDDTTEPTTPPNNPRDVPSKFNNANFQNIGQYQGLPLKNQNGNEFVNFSPGSSTNPQLNQKFTQQSLPAFSHKLFKPQSVQISFQNDLQSQGLPKPVPAYIFDEMKPSAQFNIIPQDFRSPSNSFSDVRNPYFEIQKSQQLALKQFKDEPVKGSNNPSNFNFNNQNSINLQTSFLPGLAGIPQQKPSRNNIVRKVQNSNQRMDERLNQISRPESEVELLSGNRFSNEVFGAKRASSSRRGGKVTAAPERQYLTPVSTTVQTVAPPPRRRKPTTTEATQEGDNPVTRRPNISIANAFAGRLFLLQPDGRLEPVILKRANPNGFDASDKESIITPAELTQRFYNPVL